MQPPWQMQIASDVIRDGLGVELLDGDGNIAAEVFRCDADHTVTTSIFAEGVPQVVIDELVAAARKRLEVFEDGSRLPVNFNVEKCRRTSR
jgi:hypothetical protein